MSYGELHSSIMTVAKLLSERGIGPADTVAFLMKNSVAFIQFAFAASHLGAVFLPLNFRLSAQEVDYIIADAGAKLIVVDEELSHLVKKGREAIIVDRVGQADAASLADGPAVVEPYPVMPGDLMRLMYTSGTTDRPKGVMHTYDNFYWKSADHLLALQLHPETRLLVIGPLYHVGAFDLPGVAVLWSGGMLSIQREFDAVAVLAAIDNERLNAAWLAPVMTTALLTCEQVGDYDLSSLQWVIGGGERTPESRIRQFAKVFPTARYIDAYGLTESCSGDTLMPSGFEMDKIGSTGRALTHVAVSIRGDGGEALAANEEGEICLRGPKVTKGYWNDPEKTASAFFGSWFRTGDVGYLDEDGFLFLTDRKKDMIISGGENIASSEIERVMQSIPDILEVAIIGVPDTQWGERPVAIYVCEPDTVLTEEEIRTYCRANLASFKVPAKFVRMASLPRNASGKILKRELRDLLADGLPRLN